MNVLGSWIFLFCAIGTATSCPGIDQFKMVILHGCEYDVEANSSFLHVFCPTQGVLTPEMVFRRQRIKYNIFLVSTESVDAHETNKRYCLRPHKLWFQKSDPDEFWNVIKASGNDFKFDKKIRLLLEHFRILEGIVEFPMESSWIFGEAFCKNASDSRCLEWGSRNCYYTEDCIQFSTGEKVLDTAMSTGHPILQLTRYLASISNAIQLKRAKVHYMRITLTNSFQSFPPELNFILGNLIVFNLTVSDSQIRSIAYSNFPSLPQTKVLGFPNCGILQLEDKVFAKVPLLEYLDLTRNKLKALPESVFHLTKLATLSIGSNRGGHPTKAEGCFRLNSQNETAVSTVAYLLASDNLICSIDDNNLRNFRHLVHLDIGRSRIQRLSESAFEHLIELRRLDLSGNELTELPSLAFLPLKAITEIDLSSNRLSKNLVFISNIGSYLQGKNVSINLDNNLIQTWNSGDFLSNGYNTSSLNISMTNNKIAQIDQGMFTSMENLLFMDLANNPFDCSSCNLRYLQEWLNRTVRETHTTSIDQDRYVCAFPHELQNVPILDAPYIDRESCAKGEAENYLTIAAIVGLSVSASIIVVIAIACVYFRWYLRYLFYLFRGQINLYQQREEAKNGKYLYDAFVSYCSQDIHWVKNYLVPKLENEAEFKLCLHDRNFEPGETITDNIIQSINTSRKIVLVVSENFVRSKWCALEAQLAQYRLYDQNRNAMVIIKLTDLDEKAISKKLRYLMKTRTYLEWPKEEHKKKLFWVQLEIALGEKRRRSTLSILERHV